MQSIRSCRLAAALGIVAIAGTAASAGVISGYEVYGDMDMLNQDTYPDDPTAGATLIGLAPGAVTFATNQYFHPNWPFTPEGDDFPGTDTMYAGAFNYAGGDGYSNSAGRVNGAQVIVIDYSGLIADGQTIISFTLGIAADDFQFPTFGNPFTAVVNGSVNPVLSEVLNNFNQTGPFVQYFTIGIDPASLSPDHTLELIIRQAAGGEPGAAPFGDGWAIDFLTVGVETVPTPGAAMLAGLAAIASLRRRR